MTKFAPPEPVKEIASVGCSGSLVVAIVKVADLGPAADGVNVTLSRQVELASALPKQVSLSVKSPGFRPANEADEIGVNANPVEPELDNVTVRVDAASTGTLPKASVAGETAANGVPAPKAAVFDHAEVIFEVGVQYRASGLKACTL